MSEALNLIIDYGFNQLKLHKIEAYTHRDNKRSKKLLETNGFQLIKFRTDSDNAYNVIFELENFKNENYG